MDFNAVKVFVKVVQAGSFSAAARKLNIPVATVSRRVSELESQLSVRLLERSTRSLRLTDLGQVFYQNTCQGVECFNSAMHLLQQREESLQGRLRISIPPNFEPFRQVIADFQNECPNVSVEVHVSETKLELIENGFDVALRVGDEKHQGLIARKLIQSRHVLVAAPAYLARHGSINHPNQLIDLPCATWNTLYEPYTWVLGGKAYNITPFLSINDFTYLKSLAVTGCCVTELPYFFARDSIASGELMLVLAEFPFAEQNISLMYPSRTHLAAVVRRFIDKAIEHVESNKALYEYQPSALSALP